MEITMAPLRRLSKIKPITLAIKMGREQSREPRAKLES